MGTNFIGLLGAGLIVGFAFPYENQAFTTYVVNGKALSYNLQNPVAHPNIVNPATKAIRFYLAPDAFSQANQLRELNAIRDAFAQWQVPGTTIKFELNMAPPGDWKLKFDNTNIVYWTRSLAVGGSLQNITGITAYTEISFDANNSILETDLVFNGVQFGWFTDLSRIQNTEQFVEAVAAHEIGHALGLDHSTVGGATVITSPGGINFELGLSADESAAARYLYPSAGLPATLGYVRGRVTSNGSPVFGAVVTLQTAQGNVAASAVSRLDGTYEMGGVAPGNHVIRVSPVDPNISPYLFRGIDISAFDYGSANTSFLASSNYSLTLAAGTTNSFDFAVTAGQPPFRITSLSKPTAIADLDSIFRSAVSIPTGVKNYYVGISGPSLPTSNATLSITGDGLTIGPTIFKPHRFNGLNVISAYVTTATNITPGLRSFVLTQGNNIAYANGYLEVIDPREDVNFDGISDSFQRTYFSPWTGNDAKPGSDPDGDTFSNRYEYNTGTNPTNSSSFGFAVVQKIVFNVRGANITWQSDEGKKYQVYGKKDVAGATWEPLGAVLTATGASASFSDPVGATVRKFYRVQMLP